MQEPFVLFCAGEDSGDVLGEAFVQSIVQRGMLPVGTGGSRMQNAGLVPIAEFNELPVSGFLDVLPRTAKLQKVCRKLKDLLCSEECKAFIAIDYPGFNMKLCQVAKKMGKPVLYVAPPQIWAWKPGRAQKLDGVNLAVLFQFEKEAYAQKGVNADVLLHPFLLHENLYHTLPYSEQLDSNEKTSKKVKLIVPRESLIPSLESYIQKIGEAERQQFSVQVSPEDSEERRMLFGAASMALATPGTVTLELALSGAPLVVATKPDLLTYALGKLLVKTRTFAMPNILMKKMLIPEFIGRRTKKMVPQILAAMHNQDIAKSRQLAVSLTERLGKGFVPDCFVDKLFNG